MAAGDLERLARGARRRDGISFCKEEQIICVDLCEPLVREGTWGATAAPPRWSGAGPRPITLARSAVASGSVSLFAVAVFRRALARRRPRRSLRPSRRCPGTEAELVRAFSRSSLFHRDDVVKPWSSRPGSGAASRKLAFAKGFSARPLLHSHKMFQFAGVFLSLVDPLLQFDDRPFDFLEQFTGSLALSNADVTFFDVSDASLI